MRAGKIMAVDCKDFELDFVNTYTAGETDYPTATVFNFEEWRKKDNYMKVVRENENHNEMGNKNTYMMNPDFSIALLSQMATEEEFNAFKAKIPNLEHFKVFHVKNE